MSESSRLYEFFIQMSFIRAFEEVVAEGYRDQILPGLLHLSMGAEATAVGVISALNDSDKIYSSHRPHGHFLAAGTDARSLMAELAGMESGLCRGRAGSMHLMDDHAIMATGIVGGTLAIALGNALILPKRSAAVVFFGDGAVQTGTFHETMNMAALWGAPLLFVCENNGKIEFSSREEHTPVKDITQYGQLYGMPARNVDGCDVETVASVSAELLEDLRSGGGPALLVCDISRLRPHYEGDLRQQGEMIDPLERCIQELIDRGAVESELRKQHSDQLKRARSILESVLRDEVLPDPEDDIQLVYALKLP